jgi:hypothetical protein
LAELAAEKLMPVKALGAYLALILMPSRSARRRWQAEHLLLGLGPEVSVNNEFMIFTGTANPALAKMI